MRTLVLTLLDDLDMEFLANLPTQPLQPTEIRNENGEVIASTELMMKENKKSDAKNARRWKNWGWKYSPGGKTSSIEEEPDSPKKSLSSKNSSPNASPKTKKPPPKDEQLIPLEKICMRRKKSPASKHPEVRSSAGARLCMDESFDDSGDELQALLENGRPASIHIIQTSSGYAVLNQ